MTAPITRRMFVTTALGAACLALTPGRALADLINFNFLKKKGAVFPYQLTERQWRDMLGPAYDIVRGGENETAGTSVKIRERREGTYHCRGCDQPLFSSSAKVMANDYPTFRAPIDARRLGSSADFGIVLPRTEIHCKNCGSHLGYKFMVDDNAAETWRYAINGTSLTFRAR